MKKNPQHLWVLLFGAGNRPPRRDTHRACESWRTSRRALEKKGTYRSSCQGSSHSMWKMEVVPAEQEASYRQCGHARTSRWSQELSSRCIGDWPRQEHRPEPRSMQAQLCYDTLWRKQLRRLNKRLWRWRLFLMSVFCVWRRQLACVLGMHVRDSSSLVFWNSKTGTEGWQRRPVPPWLRPFVEWLYDWAVGRGCARDDLLFPAGSAQLEKTLADIVHGTTWSRHRWHCLRRGAAAACWRRGPALPHFKWWGRWAATATAMAYALGYRDEDVVAPLCLWGVSVQSKGVHSNPPLLSLTLPPLPNMCPGCFSPPWVVQHTSLCPL